MKKTLLFCVLFAFPGQALAVTPPAQDAGALDWSVQKTWKLSTKPIDFVQSLDNKMVFVLGEDNTVHIYSVNGKPMGTIPVNKSTVAIDIAPRGEMLYLVDGNKTYTSIDISFTQKINVTGSPFLGKENAPVTMVVFSDFQ
jgi:protein-disulfide isomerase